MTDIVRYASTVYVIVANSLIFVHRGGCLFIYFSLFGFGYQPHFTKYSLLVSGICFFSTITCYYYCRIWAILIRISFFFFVQHVILFVIHSQWFSIDTHRIDYFVIFRVKWIDDLWIVLMHSINWMSICISMLNQFKHAIGINSIHLFLLSA